MMGQPAKSVLQTCPHCGSDLPQKPGAGRVRQYCTPEAGKAYRQRLRALGFPI